MERKHFQYRVEATVLITKAELGHIMTVAEKHYDSKCQEFGATIRYWYDCYGNDDNAPPETVKKITVKWDEFDIVSKILEMESYHSEKTGIKLADSWWKTFRDLRDEQDRINAHWMMKDTETYTDNYRAELAFKYGDGTAIIPQPAKG